MGKISKPHDLPPQLWELHPKLFRGVMVTQKHARMATKASAIAQTGEGNDLCAQRRQPFFIAIVEHIDTVIGTDRIG